MFRRENACVFICACASINLLLLSFVYSSFTTLHSYKRDRLPHGIHAYTWSVCRSYSKTCVNTDRQILNRHTRTHFGTSWSLDAQVHTHRHTCAHSSVAQCCDGFCKMEFGCGVELAKRIHCEGPWAGNSNMKFGSPGSYPEVPTACQHASPVRVYNQS